MPPSIYGLSPNLQLLLPSPVIDVGYLVIGASYSAIYSCPNAVAVLIFQNFTNQIIDFSFDGGSHTQGHLGITVEPYYIELKNNKIVLAANTPICLRANSLIPTNGFVAISFYCIP